MAAAGTGNSRKKSEMKRLLLFVALWLCVPMAVQAQRICFVFMSDPHYGLEREFRGRTVSAEVVNRAMAEAVAALPAQQLPDDGGVRAGEEVGALDFVVCGGDIANRMEQGVQPASESWRQFAGTWLAPGMPRVWLLAGNHDLSNAIGYVRPLDPERDATCAAEIFNRTMHPDTLRTAATFDYATDRVRYSFVWSGIRFVFAGMWPDTPTRGWLAEALAGDGDMPSLLFTHSEPDAEAKQFINPYGDHSINAEDGFENLIGDTCSVGRKGIPVREYRQLAAFLRTQPTIGAWFHGNTNYNEFYTWRGPDGDLALPVFRVDSPMKGERSDEDESLLSFHVVCIDAAARTMTVREYLWNRTPACWGESATVTL